MTPDTIAVAVGAFALTNIDDFVALSALFLVDQSTGGWNTARIWIGQFVGIAALVVVSLLAAVTLAEVSTFWMRWLALLPIAIGVRALVRWRRHPPSAHHHTATRATTLAVTAVTVANGADNVAVYVPLFHGMAGGDAALTVACFAVLTAVWCTAASLVGRAPGAARVIRRIGPRLVPFAYLAIGTVILVRSFLG